MLPIQKRVPAKLAAIRPVISIQNHSQSLEKSHVFDHMSASKFYVTILFKQTANGATSILIDMNYSVKENSHYTISHEAFSA